MAARFKEDSDARVISDRDGKKYHRRDMVREPGTGYLVHRNESDGEFNLVDHPANHIQRYVKFGDPYPTKDARPDISWDQTSQFYLTDDSGNVIVDDNNISIFI